MVLLKYFKRVDSKKPKKVETVLPKVDGPRATLMPVSSIEAVNKVVREKMMENASGIETHEGEDREREGEITTLQSRAPSS